MQQAAPVGVIRVRGRRLPDGDVVDLYADGDRWTDDAVPGAELVAEGWLLPGLVDAHTHPGAESPGEPLDEEQLRADLQQHLRSGVTLLRAPGLAGDPPAWFGQAEDLPRAVHAGRWIAQPGQFFDGWARHAAPDDLPRIAAAQARGSGWAKLIGDWGLDDAVVSPEVLGAVVEAVHAVGGRVAVHSQRAEGGAAAVSAGVDSLEHGMCLDPALLVEMARRGTALTPTLAVLTSSLAQVRARPDSPRRNWFLGGAEVHGQLAADAADVGVTLLAGTDSRPPGRIADEVRALARAGVSPHVALGAASWTARTYLGLDGLQPGAPADAIVYDTDPRNQLDQLEAPRAIILRGQIQGRT